VKNYKGVFLCVIFILGIFSPEGSYCVKPIVKSLIVYDAPEGLPHNTDYSVQVRQSGGDWKDLYEYDAEVGRPKTFHTSYVTFDSDFSKRIEVKVTKSSDKFNNVRIRPASYGIALTKKDNTVSFFLDKPLKLSVEFDGDIYRNLQVFANSAEKDPPKKDDPGVIYFGPGIHEAGPISLTDNQILYLAGGSVVHGSVSVSNARNVKILGRGILDNSTHSSSDKVRMIRISNSSDVTIDGIIIVDAQQWTVVPTGSDHIKINNIKILNDVIYSDGIDVVSCQDVIINDVFIRNGDDCISIKARGTEPNRNISITNSIFWSDAAHAILIGPEANATVTEKVNFEKNEVLELNCPGKEWWGAFGITNSGNQLIRDITFKDINVDDFTLSDLFNIRIDSNRYVPTPGNSIKNIKFINVSYNGSNKNANLIKGYDDKRFVDSVLFKNLRINGRLILNANEANVMVEPYAYNIFFRE
jgi:hypothetical protein